MKKDMPIFEIKNLVKSFGGLRAIDRVSFSIKERSITSLIGPNGAGKTTAFSLITGFLKPDSGNVLFHGRDITGMAPHKIVNLGIVRTFQDVRILSRLTVLENIMVGLKSTHELGLAQSLFWGKKARTTTLNKVHEIMEYVGLRDVARELAEDVSYAEQKLIILARALATDPQLLLLDEPASGLDHESIERMMTLLNRFVQGGKTVFLVEHNMDVVINISDYVIVLDFGKKIAEGLPEEIRRNEKVLHAYLGAS
ncbi:MAG: ABC transporter ATP-binding protein [Desulfobacterales bacterium]|nr:ABC transporter ATP-binding protein [Desulfobacterales bacterium]